LNAPEKIPRLREVCQQLLIRNRHPRPHEYGAGNEAEHGDSRTKAFQSSHHDSSLLQPSPTSAKRGGRIFLSQAICIFYLTLATRLHKQRPSIL
jgi:hypothetical protein